MVMFSFIMYLLNSLIPLSENLMKQKSSFSKWLKMLIYKSNLIKVFLVIKFTDHISNSSSNICHLIVKSNFQEYLKMFD